MFFETGQQIPLQDSREFFVKCSIFEDNSLYIITSSKNDTLVQHYSNYKLLNQYTYPAPTYHQRAGAFDPYQIILIHPQLNKIQYLNLKSEERVSHDFVYQKIKSPFQCQLKMFQGQKCFCIIQKYRENQARKALLTFFNLKLEKVYDFICEDFDANTKLFEIGFESKLLIVKGLQTGVLKLSILNFKDRTYLPFETVIPPAFSDTIVIKTVHQISQEKLLVFCQSKTVKLFEWNLSNGEITNFQFQGILSSSIFQILFGKDYYYILLFQTDPNNKSFIVVDAVTLKIVESFVGKVDHQHQYQVEMVNGHSRMLQVRVEKYGRPKYVGTRVITIVDQKELYINMLEEMGGFSEEMIRYIINSFKYN